MKVFDQLFFRLILAVLIIFTVTGCSEFLPGDRLEPGDDSTVATRIGTIHHLTWDTVEDAIGYQVQIAESEAELEMVPVVNVEKPSYSFGTPLAVGTALYWRVRPKTFNQGNTEWSTVYVFFVNTQKDSGQESEDTDEDDVEDEENREKHGDKSRETANENDRENNYDKSDEHIYIDPSEIPMKEWKDLMGEFFAWDAASDLPPNEFDFRDAIEFCNRRSSAEGRDPAYRLFSGEVILLPWADGYRLKPLADWGGHYKERQENKRKGRWPHWDSSDRDGYRKGKRPDHESPARWDSSMSSLSPSGDEIVTSAIVPFHWDSVDGAASYQIQIWDARMMVNTHSVEVEDSFHAIEALPNGTWHWRARAIGQKGEEGDWSDIIRFRKRWGAVRGLQPPVNSELADRTPTLSWDAVSDAAFYQLQITRPSSSFMRSDIIDLSEPYYTPDNPLDADQMYFWRVRAVDVYGQVGFWSKVLSFMIIWSGEINGLNPADGSSTLNPAPTFSWNPVDGVDGYQMQIAADEADLATAREIDLKVPFYTWPEQLDSGTTYYWRVRALNSDGQPTLRSEVSSFSVDSPPVVSGLKPDDDAVTYNTRQSLSWEPVDDAAKYQILLTNSLNTVAASTPVDVMSGEKYLPPQDLSLDVWYWQVRSVSEYGTVSQWSPIQKFSVSDGRLSLVEPVNDEFLFDQTPSFAWSSAAGAASYRLQIAEDSSSLASAPVIPVYGTGHTPADSEALAFGRYNWRIQAVDTFGNSGSWTADWPINIVDSQISGLTPLYAMTDSKPYELSWDVVQHAETYEIQLVDDRSQLVDTSISTIVEEARYQPSSSLSQYKVHYWRVRALDAGKNPGLWSQTRVLVAYDSSQHGENMVILADGTQFNSIEDLEDGYVFVPGSTFMMGENSDQEVTLSSYSINPMEVTHEEFLQFLNDTSVEIQFEQSPSGRYITIDNIPVFVFEVGVPYPIIQDDTGSQRFVFQGNRMAPDIRISVFNVSWYGALRYANWLSGQRGLEKVYTFGSGGADEVTVNWNANGFRLPTDAEWEYAGRGGPISMGYKYAGSNNHDDVAWYWDNSHYGENAHIGGELRPNELNLFDMSGNVREFCWDWVGFGSTYAYSRDGQTDPTGPSKDEVISSLSWGRTVRGGGISDWSDQLLWFETTFPYPSLYDIPSQNSGIRLVRQ